MQLSEEDTKLSHWIAENRNVNERKLGANNWTADTSYMTNLRGAMGEVAVARHYGVEPDTVFAEVGGGGDFDLEIAGYNVEVKSTEYFNNVKMMVAVHTYKAADAYFRCCVDAESGYIEIVGWLTKEELVSHEPGYWRGDDRLPLSYIVDEEDLRRPRQPESAEPEVRHDPEAFSRSMQDEAPENALRWFNLAWTEESLTCERQMGKEHARLYPYVGDVKPPLHPVYETPEPRRNRVAILDERGTRRGILLQVFEGACSVLLDSEEARAESVRRKVESKAKAAGKKKPPKQRLGEDAPAFTVVHHRKVIPEELM